MSNYNTLKTIINANIKQNGNQEITGQILNSVLNQMVTTLGAGYQFAGIATIATNPGTPDAKVFYIANGKGTYEKFGGIEVTEDEVVVLYYDTEWHKVATGIASQAKLSELESEVEAIKIDIDGHSETFTTQFTQETDLDVSFPIELDANKEYTFFPYLISGNLGGVVKLMVYHDSSTQLLDENINLDLPNKYTFAQKVTYIRLYRGKSGILESGSISIDVSYADSIKPKVHQLESEVEAIHNIKLDKKAGFNLVNPDEIEYYKYILPDGEIGDYGGKSLAVSGYIKVNEKDIATNAKVSSNVGSINVYDANKNLLRTLTTKEYKYKRGDYYIRFTIDEADKESNRMANYGDILFQYYPYSEIDGYFFGSEPKHRVLWVGTSIPEGTPYPQNACRNLGYLCYNKSLGSSRITIGEGTAYSRIAGIGLAESSQEKAIRYAAWETGTPEEQAQYKRMMDWGYDKLIIPYIDGTIDACDYVVIDHGINDRNAQFATMIENFNSLDLSIVKDDSDYDRNNFVEAFCFIIKKIWQANPKVRILVCSYLENKTGSPEYPNDVQGRMGYQVCELLKRIAGHFDFPYLNQCDYLGFGVELMPGTSNFLSTYNATYGTSYTYRNFTGESNPNSDISRFQYYCPDGLHPHTDNQGIALPILESVMTKLLRDL